MGQLESDRIEIVAESNEPIVSIAVEEGEELAAGARILAQDTTRIDLRIREARAELGRIEAVLAEQLQGPRRQQLDVARAGLEEARIERNFLSRELERLDSLLARDLTSVESMDQAQKLLDSAQARVNQATARLAELEEGTRIERLDQTRGMLQQAQARLEALEFDRSRLLPTAPVDSLVDSLPFELGERPRPGDVIAVLLTGEQPHARIYVPEPQRVRVRVGTRLQLHVDGLDEPLIGTVQYIASEASFTPYFALTERDRSRLSYLARVALPQLPQRLPDGVPVQAVFDFDGGDR